MTPEQARDLRSELESISKETRAVAEGALAATLTKRPPGGGWSVAEILQHLILTADAMLPRLEKAVVELELQNRKADGPAGLGVMGWLLVKALEPPPRMKSKTSKPFEPVQVDDPLGLPERLVERNAKLDALIARASGLATGTVKIASPFDERVRYNAYAAFRITLAHARRHLWQAREARAAAAQG